MLRGVVLLFVDAQDDCDVLVFGRRGDNDFLDRALQVFPRLFAFGEEARGFDHDLGAQRCPVEGGGVLDFEDADRAAVDADAILAVADFGVEVAQHGVVFQ